MSAGSGALEVRSPDGRLVTQVSLSDAGRASFTVTYDGHRLFADCPLGIRTSLAAFCEGLAVVDTRRQVVDESYQLLSGKASASRARANELTVVLGLDDQRVDITFRVADDGLAFRYGISGTGPIALYGEDTAWRLDAEVPWRSWCQATVNNYEGFYPGQQGLPAGHLNFPALLHKPGQAWVLLTEAAVFGDNCGSHLLRRRFHDPALHVVPAEDQTSPVMTTRPLLTPWRVAIIGAELAQVVESLLVEDLNQPCELADTGWIRPGRVYWSWWAGDPQEDLGVHRRYVDTAASLGLEYYLADAKWQEEWLDALVAHGDDRGVGILVWFHHRDLRTQQQRDAWFGRLQDKGVRGVKVDFFDSDCQERLQIYDALAVDTAAHHLVLNYHGATKPAGERRRWPHLLTREGVYGAEYYKIGDGPTAEHNCTLPFTRNVVGPMDYTPLSVSDCGGQTTIGQQLALPVVFESGLQHLSDPPDALKRYGPGLDLLRACPTVWDETRLLAGYPGDSVVLARRRGQSWFVGAISASDEERTFDLPVDFVGDAAYMARLYQDDDQGIGSSDQPVEPGRALQLHVPPRGGAAVHLTPA